MSKIDAIRDNIRKVIVGKDRVIDLVLTALVAGGHVLLDDTPGTGKTMLAKSLARSLGADFSRIQFTPDLLPSDVTGLSVYSRAKEVFEYKEGPVFCNVLLADEINRATPRTQSSLLECMEEGQVTADGVTRPLEKPFFVIATQNPVETTGTFPLPEAQLDRFLMKLSIGFPEADEELEIINRFSDKPPVDGLSAVCSKEELLEIQKSAKNVYLHDALKRYIVALVQETRSNDLTAVGVSPRGTLALANTARCYALIKGRKYVIPEDIKELAVSVLAHRLVLKGGSFRSSNATAVINTVLARVAVPTENWGEA